MKPLTILAALAACTMVCTAANPRTSTPHTTTPKTTKPKTTHEVDWFKKLDKNHDGFISPEEFTAGGKDFTPEEFKKLDTNSDGKLNEVEFSAMPKPTKPGKH